MSEFETLGPAEKHVAEGLRRAVETATSEARQLLEALEEIDTDHVEEAMLDSERKETVIAMVEPMQKLAQNLGQSGLMPLVVKLMLDKAKAKDGG